VDLGARCLRRQLDGHPVVVGDDCDSRDQHPDDNGIYSREAIRVEGLPLFPQDTRLDGNFGPNRVGRHRLARRRRSHGRRSGRARRPAGIRVGRPHERHAHKIRRQGSGAEREERACPPKPEKTERTTVSGEPAIIDELHCGVFALSADLIHDGQVYVFFTYEQPGDEAAMRVWFRSLLKTVSLD